MFSCLPASPKTTEFTPVAADRLGRAAQRALGRAQPRSESLVAALEEAALCGVTRLADITGLDRVGIPVFQAIRPASRALSVHQGKGLTAEAAMIGALMEAVECDHTEAFVGHQRLCAYAALDEAERAPDVADFASARRRAPERDEPLAWVEAERLDGAGRLWVPFDVVSLDCTRRGDPRLDRSSNGAGARFDREGAILKALLEVIERDAQRAWLARPLVERSLDRLDLETVGFPSFEDLARRLAAAGLRLAIWRQEAVIEIPVFVAELTEPGAEDFARGRACGTACHPLAEAALVGAILEAAQSRLTSISAVRDDILYPQSPSGGPFGYGLPLPVSVLGTSWPALAAAFATGPQTASADLVRMLDRAGYPGAAIVDLSRAGRRAHVVKAIVPGLGAFGRRRREPLR